MLHEQHLAEMGPLKSPNITEVDHTPRGRFQWLTLKDEF